MEDVQGYEDWEVGCCGISFGFGGELNWIEVSKKSEMTTKWTWTKPEGEGHSLSLCRIIQVSSKPFSFRLLRSSSSSIFRKWPIWLLSFQAFLRNFINSILIITSSFQLEPPFNRNQMLASNLHLSPCSMSSYINKNIDGFNTDLKPLSLLLHLPWSIVSGCLRWFNIYYVGICDLRTATNSRQWIDSSYVRRVGCPSSFFLLIGTKNVHAFSNYLLFHYRNLFLFLFLLFLFIGPHSSFPPTSRRHDASQKTRNKFNCAGTSCLFLSNVHRLNLFNQHTKTL